MCVKGAVGTQKQVGSVIYYTHGGSSVTKPHLLMQRGK